MSNKALNTALIILILLLIGAGGSAYYFYFEVSKWKTGAKELGTKLRECEIETEKLVASLQKCKEGTKEITSAQLEMFPAGIQPGPGVQGVSATTFTKEDQMGISGQAILSGKASLTFQILDENGEVVQGRERATELKGTGSFGMCCISLPETAGRYNLKLFLDGKEAKILPFEVVP